MIASCLRKVTLAFAFSLLFIQAAQAQIASVVRGGGSMNCAPVIAPTGLGEDVLAYCDRNHEYNNIPPQLVGAQYVMVSNSDKVVADYSLAVTMASAADLLLLIDNRVGDDDNTNGPDLTAAMQWVVAMGFVDTGLDLGVDESGDGDIDETASIFSKVVPGGATVLLEQDDGVMRNMYGVAAQPSPDVPVTPSIGLGILALLLAGAGGLALRRRGAFR